VVAGLVKLRAGSVAADWKQLGWIMALDWLDEQEAVDQKVGR